MARPDREASSSAFAMGGDRPERLERPSWETRTSSDTKDDLGDAVDLPMLTQQVSFQDAHPSTYHAPVNPDLVKRRRSLVKPERRPVDVDSALYNYRLHTAAYEADGTGRVGLSRTGEYPQAGIGMQRTQPHPLRRGVSILAREDPGASILKRGATLRRSQGKVGRTEEYSDPATQKAPLSPWMVYAWAITGCIPASLLRSCGLQTRERQLAWREKIAILSIVFTLMAAVGFLTFGFTQAVCGKEPLSFKSGTVASGSMIFHGWDYSMDKFQHPGAPNIVENSNPLYQMYNTGGMDGSFMFQNVNGKCLNILLPAAGTGIPTDGNRMAWYFPCNLFNQYGTSDVNITGYTEGQLCHTQNDARDMFAQTYHSEVRGMKRAGSVYFTWDQIRNQSRNLGVYQQHVLDFSLLQWLDKSQVTIPSFYEDIMTRNDTFAGQDVTMQILRNKQKALADCLVDIIRVGTIASRTIGCVASDVVLYASLVVIIGVVVIKFAMAVFFGWFMGWKLGNYNRESRKQARRRQDAIENWSEDIYRPAPAHYRPNALRKAMLPTKSRFSTNALSKPGLPSNRYPGNYQRSVSHSMTSKPTGLSIPGSPSGLRGSPSTTSLVNPPAKDSRRSSISLDSASSPTCPWPLHNVVPQPSPDYQPYGFPLVHTFCLVTAYSESTEGLRTTLDSLATTDYANSHKMLLIVADGMVKGSGNKLTTPEIVLEMMKDFVIPPNEVEPNSYVAIADGHKRHNMAKVYAGFYAYDDRTVESAKQQRVPMVLVAKVGNPLEAHDPKPGNRGKRDSQVLLMNFLQKVMFDERMTTFEYEFFNAIWRVTGVTPDLFQLCLMVDADTKVFPDSLVRMVSAMVKDTQIMGLCGETKIANKRETWVTMIQVFEYYLAHHQTKAFESIFGGVTCLPGCFSMYRIKAPKGSDGYWVPIIANPDVVEHYSENVVDTLHKKNLLLLGEDRYLSTLMLKTFPKRKMMFCPSAVCKTIVPDTFRVLLSQRRRWINSTVHNLFELLFVNDLCGTFCFSMQFVVFMDLVGTLVLPAAIAFTMYLLIITCIPDKPKPVVSLILLAIILGLPGILIVITSRKIVYVGWMLIYLFSLPIWNFVLPFYSYLHMDDFSWGQTRQVQGDKGGNHGDKEGEFDSSHIVMKRWAEFERERRWKTGRRHLSFERGLAYQESHISTTSSSEHMYTPAPVELPTLRQVSQPSFAQHSQQDEHSARAIYPAQLELPAPLAPGLRSSANSSPSYSESMGPTSYQPHSGSSSPWPAPSPTYASVPSMQQQQQQQPRGRSKTNYQEEGTDAERQAMLFGSPESPSPLPASTLPESLASSSVITEELSEVPSLPLGAGKRSSSASRYAGGVSLRDDGPVAAQGGFRAVQRARRASRTNRNSGSFPAGEPASPRHSLPAGARPS